MSNPETEKPRSCAMTVLPLRVGRPEAIDTVRRNCGCLETDKEKVTKAVSEVLNSNEIKSVVPGSYVDLSKTNKRTGNFENITGIRVWVPMDKNNPDIKTAPYLAGKVFVEVMIKDNINVTYIIDPKTNDIVATRNTEKGKERFDKVIDSKTKVKMAEFSNQKYYPGAG